MDGTLQNYILLHDRVGEHFEKGWITTKNIPTQLLRGEIFEALPETEQPEDPDKVALRGKSQKIKLECPTLAVSKITDRDAELLLAVTSKEERFRLYREKSPLKFGDGLVVSSKVFVKLKTYPKEVPGVIRYKGNLPTCEGIMFGVELMGKDAEGLGTTDGTFRGKRCFDCLQDCGVFVALDKLRPRLETAKSPEEETSNKSILSSLKDFIPSFSSKDSHSQNKAMAKEHNLKIDQRVVLYVNDLETRGTVRYISDTTDSKGNIAVGIELDKGNGKGTGKFKGKQRFVCKKDYAVFVPASTVIPEEDFESGKSGKTYISYDRLSKSDGFSVISKEQEEIKRSSSATSMFSKASEEAMKVSGGDIANKEKFIEEQKGILQNIQLKQITSRTKQEYKTDGNTREHGELQDTGEPMEFHDEHYKRSPQINSELSQFTGNSRFYLPNENSTAGSSVVAVEGEQHSSYSPRDPKTKTDHLMNSRNFDQEYRNNIPATGPGTHDNVNTTTSDMNSSQITHGFGLEGTVTSSGGIVQQIVTEENQNDIEMSDPVDQHVSSFLRNNNPVVFYDKNEATKYELKVGSRVEVPKGKNTLFGVIRWIGELQELPGKVIAGLELETVEAACSDGTFVGKRYFTCPAGRAFFVRLQHCRRDSRFQPESPEAARYSEKEMCLQRAEQCLNELETYLSEEKGTLEETERRLHSAEQRSDEFEIALAEQRRINEETERRLHNADQRSNKLETSLAEEGQAREETERRLHSAEQRSDELETALDEERQAREETERRLHNADHSSNKLETSLAEEGQAREETERRLHSAEQRSDELETALAEQRRIKEETERRLQNAEQRSNELETTLATLQRGFEEYRCSKELTSDWILVRNEISLSDNEIGVGGWGRVMEGTFRGCKVAVKQIHDLILSAHNRRLFEREMSIASRCRHPCLLQFIGATNDDQSPLFVTELLDTSLRAVLHERALESTEISTIALDVAKGINYLHLNHPSPIIHRDISSANVLLWKHGQSWRAKVSDYGTANFMQHSMTVGPGALFYSAPEAQTSRQSPKVDTYSFGVLLCEMNIREFPDVAHRDEQVAMVTNHFYRDLIRRCLLQDPVERPAMETIINLLENQK